ncbi:WAT1-related protein At5g40240 isoform X2 [Ricinus communis]|uniref:WAT1-related protein At5g40240 isoform X2 n=1 Tax=Ricinus communis TaxID=3988 RepID=UPI0007728844|nr:WAT1-related protein At5g40240 isoform X2 [Ricinus communis]|eukprot:XP_015573630.1 WAT1-related protein At5g40240 isoform X2 [Ricinus communis]
MASIYCYKNILPFAAMVAAECAAVGVNTIFKAASLKGMNYYVFIFYTTLINTLVLLPILFFFCRTTINPRLSLFRFPVSSKICIVGIIGVITQIASYKGIEYSSPTLSSALSNLTLPFTFILAIVLRMEKLDFKSSRTQAKIIGTVVSISGALMVVLYKGPVIGLTSLIRSTKSDWVIGGLLLSIQYSLYSVWYIIQTQIIQIYPAEIQVTFLVNLYSTIIAAPVCFLAEPNLSAWRLRPDIELAALAYSGLFGASFITIVHLWGLRQKGPVYVTSFKPLSIAIAAAMGALFLGDALHLGSVIGAIFISVGFYALIWGKLQEEKIEECDSDTSNSPINSRSPLLQSKKVEDA